MLAGRHEHRADPCDRIAPARRTTSGDSAMKKPRSASTRRRSSRIGETRRSRRAGDRRRRRSRSRARAARYQPSRLLCTKRAVSCPATRSTKNPEKSALNPCIASQRRVTMPPNFPSSSSAHLTEDTCESKPAAQQVRGGQRQDPQGSRRDPDVARRHHHGHCRRAAKTLRSPASRSSGGSTVRRASRATQRRVRR